MALQNANGGSPLATLPIDPINNATYYYAYCAISTNGTYELDANIESVRYASRKTLDGGNTDAFYETGTNLSC